MIRKTLTILSLLGLLLSVGAWAGVTEVFGMTEFIGNHLCICKRGVLLTFTPSLPMRRHVSDFIEETRTPADARLAWVMHQQEAVEVYRSGFLGIVLSETSCHIIPFRTGELICPGSPRSA